MTFNELISEIKYDLRIDGKVNLRIVTSAFFFNPSFRLLLNYRVGRYFSNSKFKFLKLISSWLRVKQITKRSCHISFNSKIGRGVIFAHPIGIVIGDNVIIEDGVKIWQQVTFGSHGKQEQENKYPRIENGAKIFAGAKILGGITIGKNAIVGANAVVLINVPPNSVAVGIPARIIYPEEK